jgi:hypothetical protein
MPMVAAVLAKFTKEYVCRLDRTQLIGNVSAEHLKDSFTNTSIAKWRRGADIRCWFFTHVCRYTTSPTVNNHERAWDLAMHKW